tara:strand:- start:245 stop:481 length:237 start_codon:yes stop_codon:yes gene_type:complete
MEQEDTIVLEGRQTYVAHVLSLCYALKLETLGMKRGANRRSAYSIAKEEFNLKGSKKKVLEQLEVLKETLLTITNPDA